MGQPLEFFSKSAKRWLPCALEQSSAWNADGGVAPRVTVFRVVPAFGGSNMCRCVAKEAARFREQSKPVEASDVQLVKKANKVGAARRVEYFV